MEICLEYVIIGLSTKWKLTVIVSNRAQNHRELTATRASVATRALRESPRRVFC